MGRSERSIKIAFDRLTGEHLDAQTLFSVTKEAFEVRKQYHEKNVSPACYECEQDLVVSDSRYNRVHFKHKPGHSYCILSDSSISPSDNLKNIEILKSKESDRHKQLKNKIGELLLGVEGVDISAISIDNKFIIRGEQKRKPDVYCKYKDKELVFEIQLSDLSLSYILSRYNFYKENGMYLIWILNNFDIHNQGTLERDIKYLTKYQNFFKLDETSEEFKLECRYKEPYATLQNEIKTKWCTASVNIDQVKFDESDFQIYFLDFEEKISQIKERQLKEAQEREAAELAQKKKMAETKANAIRDAIKAHRSSKPKRHDYTGISEKISLLNDLEVDMLNDVLGFSIPGKYKKNPLITWIDDAQWDDISFLNFILRCDRIKIDLNAVDEKGRTPFIAVFGNSSIQRDRLLRTLFVAGYRLSDSDKAYLLECMTSKKVDSEGVLYELFDGLKDRSLIDLLEYQHIQLLFFTESAKRKKILRFNYNNWVSFANNAIQHYGRYWAYLEFVFKYYGLWDEIIKSDTNDSFKRKVAEIELNMPEQEHDFNVFFRAFFPELYVKWLL